MDKYSIFYSSQSSSQETVLRDKHKQNSQRNSLQQPRHSKMPLLAIFFTFKHQTIFFLQTLFTFITWYSFHSSTYLPQLSAILVTIFFIYFSFYAACKRHKNVFPHQTLIFYKFNIFDIEDYFKDKNIFFACVNKLYLFFIYKFRTFNVNAMPKPYSRRYSQLFILIQLISYFYFVLWITNGDLKISRCLKVNQGCT